jgi:hypothetical protein
MLLFRLCLYLDMFGNYLQTTYSKDGICSYIMGNRTFYWSLEEKMLSDFSITTQMSVLKNTDHVVLSCATSKVKRKSRPCPLQIDVSILRSAETRLVRQGRLSAIDLGSTLCPKTKTKPGPYNQIALSMAGKKQFHQ